jgi:hypothetical protein
MQIPLTIKRPLDSAEKKIASISRSKRGFDPSEQSHGEFERELQEVAETLSNALDRLMNHVWEKCRIETGQKRPNIYWPDSESAKAFKARMHQLQLGHLEVSKPTAYQIILQTQKFFSAESKWCSDLKRIAGLKHVRDAQVFNRPHTQSLGIGKGESVYIDELRIDGGRVFVRGHEISDGKIRPLTIEHKQSIVQELELVGADPLKFYRSCLVEVRSMAYRLVTAIG